MAKQMYPPAEPPLMKGLSQLAAEIFTLILSADKHDKYLAVGLIRTLSQDEAAELCQACKRLDSLVQDTQQAKFIRPAGA